MKLEEKSNFNPDVKDYLSQNPNVSMLGFFWAMYWRVAVVVLGISALIALFNAIA